MATSSPADTIGVDVSGIARRIVSNVERVIVGKRRQIVLSLVSWFCEGHILLEDVPGVAKTMLARALAQSVGCSFKRIQCTPDLLPTDITGVSVFNQKTVEFEFRPGPVFTQVLLVDEINRATPRTQSALLEAMAEGRVTVDGVSYPLAKPFLVIATQNPIDHEGTFPLPEAQLDRFFMRFSLGYPSLEEELRMLELQERSHPIEEIRPVVTPGELLAAQQAVRTIYVDEKVRRYIIDIVHKTRQWDELSLGASPRGTIALFRASQALAAITGRHFVLPDDVKRVAGAVLNHRLILRPESRIRKRTAGMILEEILAEVPVPLSQPSTGNAPASPTGG